MDKETEIAILQSKKEVEAQEALKNANHKARKSFILGFIFGALLGMAIIPILIWI